MKIDDKQSEYYEIWVEHNRLPMNLKHDNVFYMLFSSIRYDWSIDVDKRSDWMLDILPYTSVINKDDMKEVLICMKDSFIENKANSKNRFDGRSYIRGQFDYLTPEEWISVKDIDIEQHDRNENWYTPSDCICCECVEVVYTEWKRHNKIDEY